MLNCRINQNIRKECDTHNSGIYDTIYLYDINDVDSLSFTNDARFDSGASIATINSSKPFYVWEVSDGEYSEEVDGDEYTHELTANIHKTEEIENILSDAKNTSFLVAFKLKSENSYRVIGWDLGAKLTYSLTAGEDGNYYSITFTDEGIYPSFECDASNFNLKNKEFDPIFVPNFSISTCETVGGKLTGYRIASYVTKQNASGEALDEDNKLCEFSEKKQVAYKLEGVSDSQYQIIGTYNTSAIYNGQAVKVYDITHCSSTGSGTISVSPNTLVLTAHGNSQGNFTITTSGSWSITNNSPFINISNLSGKGNKSVTASWNGLKTTTSGNIQVRNENTNETVTVNTNFYGVWLNTSDTVDYTIENILVNVETVGGSRNRNISVNCSDPNVLHSIKDNGNTLNIKFAKGTIGVNGCVFTIKATHADNPNEYDIVYVKVKGDETRPDWVVVSSYCELNNYKRTGYRITRSRDNNPKSATYGTINEVKEYDEECSVGGEEWVKISEHCETDSDGQNTGYKIIVEQQITEGYHSTGQTRYVRFMDSEACPKMSTEPNWVTISQWCLTDEYGQNGIKQVIQRDMNLLSPSYYATRTLEEEDLTLCPKNTEPVWEIVTSECLQNEGGNTGYEKITYKDINPRSATMGTTKTETKLNEEYCPYGTSPVWIEISKTCQLDADGDNTGYVDILQKDNNPHSSTYGTTRTITEYNEEECKLPTTDPRWVTISYECEVDSEGHRTGNAVKTVKDDNKKSATYGQTKVITERDTALCSENAPQWEIDSTLCETDTYGQTGYKITRYIDVNPNSETYQYTKDEKSYDATTCKPNTDPYWVTESSECENE